MKKTGQGLLVQSASYLCHSLVYRQRDVWNVNVLLEVKQSHL